MLRFFNKIHTPTHFIRDAISNIKRTYIIIKNKNYKPYKENNIIIVQLWTMVHTNIIIVTIININILSKICVYVHHR
jgi:hypothetical protein